MTTPMPTDIRKVRDSDSDAVDRSLYRKLIGSLLYLMNTQVDIYFAVNTLCEFQVEPKHEHYIVANYVLRYIRGMLYYGLRYTATNDIQFHGFIDSNWAGNA
jgi:hypothetical protein